MKTFTILLSTGFIFIQQLAYPNPVQDLATQPAPREISYEWMSLSEWYEMHAEDVGIAEKGEADLVFLGDSITAGWSWAGADLWKQQFVPLGAVNFGIGGDMTQNVLWRLLHGGIGKLNPKQFVLLIGTNNFGFTGESPEAVARGVEHIIELLRNRFPESGIILMAVFPRDQLPNTMNRQNIEQLNALIEPLADGEIVSFLNINEALLLEDGKIPQSLMPDFLHLSEAGYAIWTQALKDHLWQRNH